MRDVEKSYITFSPGYPAGKLLTKLEMTNNVQIKFINVLPIFRTEIQVFFIKILPEIEFQNFHAFLSTESLFTFSTF